MRLSTAFLDLFLILLICCVVLVKTEEGQEENPESLSNYIITTTWDTTNDDVDLWGQISGKKDSACGFKSIHAENLSLHGDWTSSSYIKDRETAFEVMTIDSPMEAEYGFALHGYRISESVEVNVKIIGVQPYKVLMDDSFVVKNGKWTSICRLVVGKNGKATINRSLPVKF